MTIRDELTLVDQAQRHVQRLRLVSTVGVMPAYLPALTKYDASMLAIVSSTMEDAANWILADLLVWVEDKLAGERAAQDDAWNIERDRRWVDLLHACGREYTLGTLLNMRATARAFPWERRRHSEVLKFRHHRLLVPYLPEEQETWLDQCEAGAWSSAELERRLYWCREDGQRVAIRRMDEASDVFRAAGMHFDRLDSHHATLAHGRDMVHVTAGNDGLVFTLERGKHAQG